MTPPQGACLLNLGCRVNRVELDAIASRLEGAGVPLVAQDEARVVVVNTCAVTGEAEAKTRKAVRHAATLPSRPAVVATGCVASLFADELARISDSVVVVPDKSLVADRVLELLGDPSGAAPRGCDSPTPTGRNRPGIKVQDGCDNRCTYCIVWRARGAARSLGVDDVVSQVCEAVGRGAHEVVLTGINLGSWRQEADGARHGLEWLLDQVLERTDVERVRLSSIEPPDVTGDLCRTIAAADGRVAPFLHVCLQSGCDRTLRRMGRVYDTARYRRAVEAARSLVGGLALGTDLIVGFPGETDEDFRASLDFCREMDFAKMHVFRYSRRPGTPAASMDGQVPPSESARRSRLMRSLADEMRLGQARRLVGTEDLLLVEHPGRAVTSGLFDVLVDPALPVGSLVRARIGGIDARGTLLAR